MDCLMLFVSFVWKPLPRPSTPELTLKHIDRKVDHCRSAMWTGARGFAGFEIAQEGFLLISGKRLPAFDSHPLTDARRDAFLDLLLQGGLITFEILDEYT